MEQTHSRWSGSRHEIYGVFSVGTFLRGLLWITGYNLAFGPGRKDPEERPKYRDGALTMGPTMAFLKLDVHLGYRNPVLVSCGPLVQLRWPLGESKRSSIRLLLLTTFPRAMIARARAISYHVAARMPDTLSSVLCQTRLDMTSMHSQTTSSSLMSASQAS